MTNEEQRYMADNPLCESRIKYLLDTLFGDFPNNVWAQGTAEELIKENKKLKEKVEVLETKIYGW